jgi:hypothetical protein
MLQAAAILVFPCGDQHFRYHDHGRLALVAFFFVSFERTKCLRVDRNTEEHFSVQYRHKYLIAVIMGLLAVG